jgi:pimeloyl-ACP methyl ester carboxylesterase
MSPHEWAGVISELDILGVPAVAVELPLTGFRDDVAVTRMAIEAAGQGVIVVGHSYGGCVISAAAYAMANVARLVYVAAFITDCDENPFAILAQHRSELLDALVYGPDVVSVDPVKARHIFFGDVDDEMGNGLAARLRPMRRTTEGISYESIPAWKTLPSTYLLCSRDRAIPADAQQWMAQRTDEIIEWTTDHCPFISRAADLARLLDS